MHLDSFAKFRSACESGDQRYGSERLELEDQWSRWNCIVAEQGTEFDRQLLSCYPRTLKPRSILTYVRTEDPRLLQLLTHPNKPAFKSQLSKRVNVIRYHVLLGPSTAVVLRLLQPLSTVR